MPDRSMSMLVTWPYRFHQETICAVISVVKCARDTMGCAPTGPGDAAAVLGYFWGVRGTAVGPGGTSHTQKYSEVL